MGLPVVAGPSHFRLSLIPHCPARAIDEGGGVSMWVKRVGLVAVAAALLASSAAGALAVRDEMLERDLINDLRHGGYVVYLRHAERYKRGREDLSAASKLS